MAYEFKLPDLGEGLTEGEIARWLVAEGQEVAEDDPLVEIQTDKTTVEIPSPAAGKVARILVAEGEVVPVGTVLVVIGEADGHDGGAAAASDRHRKRRLRGAAPAEEQARAEAAPSVLATVRGQTPDVSARGRIRATPLVRRLAHDLGVAVQTEQGLVVPVVRGCDEASLDEVAVQVDRLAEGARAGRLKPEELRGSTFTVTSAGKLGGLLTTPLVNHPEVAILSIGRIADRPTVRDGKIVARPLGYLSVTFDHRVVDGARAAEFGLSVIRRLENPAS